MKELLNQNRRDFIKMGLGLTGFMTLGPSLKAVEKLCGKTPLQPEGPFYPVDDQLDKDTDLTFLTGHSERAKGQVIYVRGSVTDNDCKPINGVLVEIWQACASGKYNHPGDRDNPAPLDPHFQYWGKTVTDSSGKYLFKTIHPGSYPAGEGWIRPSHIHFKLQKRGFLELITQMYFEGDKYNNTDRILQRLKPEERTSVIVKPETPTEGFDPNSKSYTFNIGITQV